MIRVKLKASKLCYASKPRYSASAAPRNHGTSVTVIQNNRFCNFAFIIFALKKTGLNTYSKITENLALTFSAK
jgi:hypothetical protein